ncbi:MAG: apolipoprotein A1/A4/E family protein [Puniceicoccales bacterium]|jgi:hypothetical protein|nr:apolipoprotein A1/A4/E family protein [Puniceicoccales bacterium]
MDPYYSCNFPNFEKKNAEPANKDNYNIGPGNNSSFSGLTFNYKKKLLGQRKLDNRSAGNTSNSNSINAESDGINKKHKRRRDFDDDSDDYDDINNSSSLISSSSNLDVIEQRNCRFRLDDSDDDAAADYAADDDINSSSSSINADSDDYDDYDNSDDDINSSSSSSSSTSTSSSIPSEVIELYGELKNLTGKDFNAKLLERIKKNCSNTYDSTPGIELTKLYFDLLQRAISLKDSATINRVMARCNSHIEIGERRITGGEVISISEDWVDALYDSIFLTFKVDEMGNLVCFKNNFFSYTLPKVISAAKKGLGSSDTEDLTAAKQIIEKVEDLQKKVNAEYPKLRARLNRYSLFKAEMEKKKKRCIQLMGAFNNHVKPLIDKVKSYAESSKNKVKSYAEPAIGKIKSYAEPAIGKIESVIKPFTDKIPSEIKQMIEREIKQGLKQGVRMAAVCRMPSILQMLVHETLPTYSNLVSIVKAIYNSKTAISKLNESMAKLGGNVKYRALLWNYISVASNVLSVLDLSQEYLNPVLSKFLSPKTSALISSIAKTGIDMSKLLLEIAGCCATSGLGLVVPVAQTLYRSSVVGYDIVKLLAHKNSSAIAASGSNNSEDSEEREQKEKEEEAALESWVLDVKEALGYAENTSIEKEDDSDDSDDDLGYESDDDSGYDSDDDPDKERE